MANVVTYHNPLAPLATTSKEITATNSKELITNLTYDCMAYELVLSKNNEIMQGDFDIVEGDFIAVMIIPRGGGGGGGGGKDIIRTVALIAVAITAPYVAGYAMTGAWTVATGFSGALLTAGIAVAGSMLVNAILPPSTPDFGNIGTSLDNLSQSTTYGWDVIGNQTQQGISLPKIYGRHKIAPPLIGKYVETIGDKQYLHLLYALNDGQISSVENIYINDNPISNYSEVASEVRYGTNNQGMIGAFDDVKYDKSVNRKVTTGYQTVTTDSDQCQRLKVGVVFPRGLWHANDEGKLEAYGIDLEVQIAPIGGAWSTIFSGRITSGSEGGVGIKYESRIARNEFDEIIFPLKWEMVPVPINIPAEIVDSKTIRQVFDSGFIGAGQYEARVRFTSEPLTGSRYASDCYFEFIEETISDDFTYPNTALLSIRALATDQLSGGLPTVSCIVTSSHGANPTPAFVAKQMLIDSGIEQSRIDTTKWAEWESYCLNKGLTANIICDSSMSLKKWLDTVSILGRGSVVQFGSRFSPVIDKPETIPVQCFTFGMGNILKDSYAENYLPIKDRANIIEVTYYDETNDYNRTIFEYSNSNYDNVIEVNKQSINLIGCVSKNQALRHAKYALNCNRYLTITASWDADIDALVCKYGDIVKTSHDLPQYGYSGRIIDCTTTTITLDRLVPMETGKTYAIQVRRNSTNETTEHLVTTLTGETDELTFITPIITPYDMYDNYQFGEVGKVNKLFRVLRISRKNDLLSTITAIEYVPEIYGDTVGDIIPPVLSSLGMRGLLLNEYFRYEDIQVFSNIEITWRGEALYYDVFLNGIFQKRVYETRASLENVIAPATHTISIKSSFGETISGVISVLGRFAPPDTPTNFKAIQNGNVVRFSWTKSIAKDVMKYELRSGITWQTATKIGVVGNVDTFEWFPDMNNNYRFWLKAIDYSGVESETAIDVLLNVASIDENLNVIITYDGLDTVTPPCGTTTGLIFVIGVGYVPISSATYEDIIDVVYDDIPDLTYGDSSSFESCALDTTKAGLTKIRMLSNYSATYANVTYDTYPDRIYEDFPFDTYENISALTSMVLYYAISNDNITYSSWTQYTGIIDESFRYIKFKYELTGDVTGADIEITDFKALLDVPDIEYDIIAKEIVNSEAISFSTYGLSFYEAPRVIVTSKTLALGVVSSITNTGFTLTSYDVSGATTTGTFDIKLKGY